MPDLLKEIEAQIAGAKVATDRQNVGVIREVGDGVAKVEGLSDAMLNEMLDLGHIGTCSRRSSTAARASWVGL